MIQRTIEPAFGDKHKAYIQRAVRSTISVAEGAVRAGKTVDNIAAFAWLIDKGVPDKIHLATGSTSANAKLNIGDANGLGLEYIFRGRCHWTKYKGNDALVIKSHGRDYVVIFAGAAKADSFKKIRGNSYGMWIATEINLHHEDTIKEAFNRQLAAKVRKVFWDLNPSAPGAWIYTQYIDRFADQYGRRYNYEHFTIRDNATITPQRLAEIEAQYDPGSIWYKRDIEGQRCIAEGLVYPMFDAGKHVLQALPETTGDYYVSCDYGIQNATVFLLWRKEAAIGRWIAIDEYYYSGREESKQITVSELVDGFEAMLSSHEDCKPKRTIIDPSAAALIVELRKRGHHTQNAVNDVGPGIADVCTMLYKQGIAFSGRCVNTLNEFGLYSWDKKAADNGEDAPIKQNDHCMDAIRYFVKTMNLVKKIGRPDYVPLHKR
jgi:PBSX family phage terminase large subunit